MQKRAVIIYSIIILMFTGMIGRFYSLAMGDMLAQAADTQSAYILDVAKSRGLIYDCNLNSMVNTTKKTVAAVMPSPEAMMALTQAIEEGEEIVIREDEVKPYTVNLEKTSVYSKGVEMFDVWERYAPNQLAPHIIGYLNPEGSSGAAGIELAYDELLQQYNGSLKLRYMVDAYGQAMTTEAPEIIQDNFESQGGVVLTLDSTIQRAAQRAMKNVEKGAAVVMDITTGNLKAVVSMPQYDPNNLAESLKNPDSPFVNRAFSQYNVGSTFKLVTAAAALENGAGRYNPYTCKGYIDIDGHIFYCHYRNGHGEIDMKKAVEVSCNPFFIQLGLSAGGKNIISMARDIGFSKAAQLSEDIKTQSGTLPDEKELASDTAVANLSFGQGKLTATPIQVAQMACTIANGGYAITPRLVEGFTDDGKEIYEHTTIYSPVQVFSKKTAQALQEFMIGNVEEGSGVNAKPDYCTAAGKTASAQTGIYEGEEEIVHAWFAGYFPAQDPKYAIVVLVEGGDSGSETAAPIFKQIAESIYLYEKD
ncbi:peptidoglycan D,D-transpeptidase FtsI family protein [Youxingia wuxianensis]|uniref:Penicillin-binding protein 2 n=1 Tax=Youxingia wuxianensis TaxID=2763678 RepID=A0A926IHE7_9FIRM|nr:penicillin-binding protein 2 [Youxingia wuxianensis]MBC8585060.1 penicillin-binding protein 2 [Youxingia wuxianensis]